MLAARGGGTISAEEDITAGRRTRPGPDTTRRGNTKTREHRETTRKREYHHHCAVIAMFVVSNQARISSIGVCAFGTIAHHCGMESIRGGFSTIKSGG